jgi:enoyl-CoA hydratase
MTAVRYEVASSLATITLDAPHNRNALSAALVTELADGLRAAARDTSVRAVVLTHNGGTFCAGADLVEARAEGGPAAGTARLLALLRQIIELPLPVIARLDGHVRAGGLGLVGACDLAFAGPASTFAFTETRLGLAPAIISLTTLPRLADRAASRYFLTGETFDGPEATRIGLITASSADVVATVAQVTDTLRLCSPQGLAETKPLTTQRVLAAFDRGAEAAVAQSARLFGSEEAREGMASFLEKRPARWAPDATS